MRRAVLLFALAGCFESIAPDRSDGGAIAPRGPFETTQLPDGTNLTVVDSTSDSAWTHGDFETRTSVMATDAWDLRFQRFHISTNGGATGSGGVEVAPVAGLAFADVTTPPADGWIADTGEAFAFDLGDGWYDYDPMTHVLTPKPVVWVIRTDGGALLKLEITDYYDDAGTAGWFSLHWSSL